MIFKFITVNHVLRSNVMIQRLRNRLTGLLHTFGVRKDGTVEKLLLSAYLAPVITSHVSDVVMQKHGKGFEQIYECISANPEKYPAKLVFLLQPDKGQVRGGIALPGGE